ncbi:acyl-CoA thioester hydrolase [Haloechinothrix alba]|uniref:Acyl-CoA thioester hydrolase n=1 Tax=Haloechinothrix alba TaxID=664784 RepID=A0A238ZLZ1_9PSEU|nr:thioesterase family protein [Haloechinothrix alba]SNR84330.1 acyl-CoA thioester hydrolase [Haloechinothrix alba]
MQSAGSATDEDDRSVPEVAGSTSPRRPVRDEWIDYNGHLSDAYYVFVFGFATDSAMDQVGRVADYRARSGRSLHTVEAHVRYLREVPSGRELVVTSRVVGTAAKKVWLCHEMTVDGELVATEEVLAVHVDSEEGRGATFPENVRRVFDGLAEDAPEYAGRAIG